MSDANEPSMWAIQQKEFGSADVLVWAEMDKPRPQGGEVLIRVESAPVNHFDLVSRRGDYPDIPLPRIPGMDCAGVVEDYAGTRTDIAVGTKVVVLGATLGNGGPGGYASHVCISDNEVFPISAAFTVTPRQATCLAMTYLTAWYVLNEKAAIPSGSTLFIPGAGGGVALATLQLAKLAGIRIFASTGSEGKRQKLLALGAEVCLLYKEEQVPKRLRELTNGKGVDFVVDTVGGDTIQQGLASLKQSGRLITLGIVQGGRFSVDAIGFLLGEATISGVNVGQLLPATRFEIFSKLCVLVAAGKLDVIIDRVFPLANAAQAHRYIEAGKAFGKVVLEPSA